VFGNEMLKHLVAMLMRGRSAKNAKMRRLSIAASSFMD